MGRYYNRASSLAGIREIAEERGQDIGAAMRVVGLSTSVLRKPEERIEFNKICALFEYCAKAWDLPDLGFRMAPYQHLDILGPVGLVTKMECDLRRAIDAIAANLVIHSNALVAALEEEGGVATVTVDVQPVPEGTHQYILVSLGTARNVIEQAGNCRLDLIEVSFRQADNGLRAAAEAYFRCPVRFGGERNALYFDDVVLDRPIERSDAAYHAIIERYLATTLHEVAGRVSDSARHEIARQMEFGSCTLDSVAQRLRLEPRSLQRRLKQEGTAFRDLMDDWRRARALSLVTHTRLPLSEVTLALGYSDQSIFTRAFQRWYGESPLAFRQKDAALASTLRHEAPRS